MDNMPTKFKITSYFKCDDFQSYELKSCNLEQANLEADTIYFLMCNPAIGSHLIYQMPK